MLTVLLLLSTSDTDLRSARAGSDSAAVDWRWANPARVDPDTELPGLLDGVDLVVVRLLGGRQAWEAGLDALLDTTAQSRPVVVLGGEQAPDAQLMESSTVPVGVATQAHLYLAQGGPDNLRELAAFLSDTVLLTGHGFAPPEEMPTWGRLPGWSAEDVGLLTSNVPAERSEHADRASLTTQPSPRVAVVYYRAHHMAGNTAFVDGLCHAIVDAGGIPEPLFCSSLRAPDDALLERLRHADVLVTTVLAAGGSRPASASAGEDDESWDTGALADLDVPILQALCLTRTREEWLADDDGVSPLDAANQVAVPEFDGRIITVPFSFKETDQDGLPVYVADPERAARVAGLAVRHGGLRHVPNADKRIALVLSAYPTKHARIGNAVGLDTPASVVALLQAMRDAGYRVGSAEEPVPGLEENDGDLLIRALIDAGGHDQDWLTEEQLAANPVRIDAAEYTAWFRTLPEDFRAEVEQHWGPAPGQMFRDDSTGTDAIVLAALVREHVVVMMQPPRGFGENPIAIYHDPDLPPSHHYLAAYRWLQCPSDDGGFGADAVVHVGKHGNLEWLPGKTVASSASCAPDPILGDLPLIYPFLVNDPGEGTQAKRRAHATLVDHLVPPMARAESYGDLARLEQLLDEYASIQAMDPGKIEAIRGQIWQLIQAAKLDHDLGMTDQPDDERFDEFVMHLDGWLCEIKDAQIRDGLHVLGRAPAGQERVDMVLAVLRARQMWSGTQALPGLREALGLDESAGAASRIDVDRAEELAHSLVVGMEKRDWLPDDAADVATEVLGDQTDPTVVDILRFAATEVVPRLGRTTEEIDGVLHALDGGHVKAGPSGSPLRGLVNVLPTGRNFYSIDPRAVPSRLAWETGQMLADSLLERYREDHEGEWPTSVGLSLWGTAAMRTSGDDIAEALALMGVRPVWDEASRRVTGLEVVDAEELGRPRVDVVLRISGFFRDAFPHVVATMDDAVQLIAGLDESDEDNFVAAHARADAASGSSWTQATTRIFGSPPGAYGAGLLQAMDSREWRGDADLAEIYTTWGGHAYGRDRHGESAVEEMNAAYRRIAVAAKNIDTREHDIADSDDYYQYHGGMIATVRALTGAAPAAYVGDSTRPESVRTRSLIEETARVFRSRVVNPRWMAAMRRHGYKGAFEMAATVDYLFGWDATAGTVSDWMYGSLTENYVLDEQNREFLREANPWALHGMAERLLEAVDRGLWENPDPAMVESLREAFLEAEGEAEGE
ncbi:cobaltochelatase subunit CobN [Actinomycetospora endophytica]|uniref:Cobaltochelatase subunit CobN n=1 Tax=Actinomycetospora endophytica TaxID=2291215 RepID=A0ABS8PCE9_9PSEU|nr:cobaltochelatase subunit CobN [Actinomycetospora endophytica]MCD2195945.1 cobaltochelatase subunit CobN [Actinomycetospora endophytica]